MALNDEGHPMLQEQETQLGVFHSSSSNDANTDMMMQDDGQQQQIHRTGSGGEGEEMNERDRLQTMGSMLDSEEEEDYFQHVRSTTNNNNNNKKQILGPSKHQASSLENSTQYTSFATQLDKENTTGTSTAATANTKKTTTTNKDNANNNNNNNNNNDENNHQLDMTSTVMMRQHRRRLLAGGQVAATILTPHNASTGILTAGNKNGWNDMVRKGTRLKSFLDDALQHVATGYAVTTQQGTKRQRVEVPDEKHSGMSNEHCDEAASDLAKDKTKEVIILQQKLEEAQAQVASLTASNETLREETTASSLRFERTIEALQIAAANAASARTDADQAELSAEGLATQLEALKTVVDQTKQAAQVLHEEHEDIATQARNGQVKLLQVEAELARSQKETKQLSDKAEEWETKAKELQDEATSLKRQLADQKEEARKLTTALEERDALEKARKERSQQVEEELREAQALLVNATSAAANTDVLENLNESVEKLQAANKALHEQLLEQQETSREDKERLRESLLVAEKDAQQLRIEASLQSDQKAGQKTTDAAVSPDGAALGDMDTSFKISTTLNMSPTPTSASGGRDSHAVPPAVTCSICFKKAFGLMKSCKCGKADCDKRAHLKCAERINPGPSVSHPGTPAAKLPLVLCSGALADIMTN